SRRRHIRAVSASAQPCIGPVRENADLLRPEIGARHKGLILADADRLEEANLSVIDQRLPEQLPRRKRPVHIVIDEIRIESRCPENWPRHYSAVDPFTLAKDNIRPFRLCNLHKIAERVLRELVVGIEEEQVLSSCLLDPMVARASGATGISLMQHLDVLMLSRILVQYLARLVSRPIVDREDLHLSRLEPLIRRRIKRESQKVFHIVDRNNHRDQRLACRHQICHTFCPALPAAISPCRMVHRHSTAELPSAAAPAWPSHRLLSSAPRARCSGR